MRSSTLCIAALIHAALCSALLAVITIEPAQKLRGIASINPGQKVAALEVGSWIVKENAADPALAVASIHQVGPRFYIEQQETGRWLIGAVDPTGPANVILCTKAFKSFDDLLSTEGFPIAPMPPPGFTIRVVARTAVNPVRIVRDPNSEALYVLHVDEGLIRIDPATGRREDLWKIPGTMGMCFDSAKRFYVVSNQPFAGPKFKMNRVTVYRTPPVTQGSPPMPTEWTHADYPYGIKWYNHGAHAIHQGPDGAMYISSGARTDGGEPGPGGDLSPEGEDELTACFWRLDTNAEHPKIEIFARGLRNDWDFTWNDKAELIATENGPDADAPEEINLVEKGKHYGFPYTYADWTQKAYPHTPDPPPGQQFELPIANLGPDGGFEDNHGKPLCSLDPHSSPSAILFLGDGFPAPYRGSFLVTRFGNFLGKKACGRDMLLVTLRRGDQNRYEATVKSLMPNNALMGPLSMCFGKEPGTIYLLENLNQRVLEFKAKQE